MMRLLTSETDNQKQHRLMLMLTECDTVEQRARLTTAKLQFN